MKGNYNNTYHKPGNPT